MARVRKALIAAAGAFVAGVVAAAVQKGGVPGAAELGAAAGIAIAAGLTAWRVPNAGPTPPAGVTGQYVGK